MNTTSFIASQVDRSFLYLMAIYAIHGILLHVFLMHPKVDSAKMNWDIVAVRLTNGLKNSVGRHNSNIIENENNNFNFEARDKTGKWSDFSNLNYASENLILSNKLLYQPKFTGATTSDFFLSQIEEMCAMVISCSSTIFKTVTPACMGVILGCIVFLLTCTDNINIS
ncbi:hypothetical protein PV325_012443 [Microctonus aethiopoides]|uniref:Uncharacterized protein n=1 Tax=Microctonus aethiopoides TaxID=144406 RepID=A0AA39KT81_9HYME|nr:hypothetical protein PV325_012443 [Microctonus aethiopoides]KAK0172857.1 hypothetical protein PV328_006124 [Microctonus aethiopoides]